MRLFRGCTIGLGGHSNGPFVECSAGQYKRQPITPVELVPGSHLQVLEPFGIADAPREMTITKGCVFDQSGTRLVEWDLSTVTAYGDAFPGGPMTFDLFNNVAHPMYHGGEIHAGNQIGTVGGHPLIACCRLRNDNGTLVAIDPTEARFR